MVVLAALSLAIWIYLAAFRGGFWRMRVDPGPRRTSEARVAVVIPARNEAALVGKAIASLLAQEYAGPVDIFLVDDHSTDGTAGVVRNDRVSVVHAGPLSAGWSGKVWAMAEGVRRAVELRPTYLLLTDADVVHAPGSLGELVARAETGGYDLVSLMVRLRTVSLAEKLLMPAFVFFFFQLYPPAWVRRRDLATAAAAGGCMLVRPEALERAGGMEAIRGAWIDDCALARTVKQSGGAVWLGLAAESASIRPYAGFAGIRRMIARSAFTQLRYSALLLAATAAAMLITYAAPVAALVRGPAPARWLGEMSWMLMIGLYIPVLRYGRLTPLWAPLLPLIAMFYLAATIESAILHWTGQGSQWKGRTSGAKES